MRIKLTDIAEVVNGATPSTNHPEYYDGTVVWATPKDLSEQHNKYFTKGERNITEQGFKSCSASMIPADNILMSSRAPIGLLAINTVPCCTNQGFKSLILDHSKCDVDYMYYYLQYHIKEIEALAGGTTFKEVSKASLEKLEIDLPPFSAQKIIGQILSSLDGKMLNNNAISFQLESLAKTIYDYWFLQFEFPNEDGKPYKSSGGKMVWNEELKREVPEGWEVERFGNLASFMKGKIPTESLAEKPNGDTTSPYVTIDVANGASPMYCNPAKMIPLNGETIMVMDGAASGDVYVGNFGILGSTFSKITSERNDISNSLIYMMLKEHSAIYKKANTGSTVPHANAKFINQLKFPIPKNNSYFSKKLDVIFDQIKVYKDQNQELASLRDFLLPMLMNGQVTFKEDA